MDFPDVKWTEDKINPIKSTISFLLQIKSIPSLQESKEGDGGRILNDSLWELSVFLL